VPVWREMKDSLALLTATDDITKTDLASIGQLQGQGFTLI
jgi:hypothetical protein